MPVNTAKVTGRRKLAFKQLGDIVEDAQQIAQGEPRVLGNWSAGQIMMHLARSMDASIDGMEMDMPWLVRLVGRLIKGRVLRGKMRPGVKLPAEAAETLIPGQTTPQGGLMGLRGAIERLGARSERVPHPVFGPLSREEWDQLHLRHAELHLSFILPDSASGRVSAGR